MPDGAESCTISRVSCNKGEIKRAQGMLANERFVSKAPAAKVEAEKEKLAKYTAMAETVAERLAQLKK